MEHLDALHAHQEKNRYQRTLTLAYNVRELPDTLDTKEPFTPRT